MIIWLILRIISSLGLLQGYYAIATFPLLFGILFPNETTTLAISIVLFAIGQIYDVLLMVKKLKFAKDLKTEEDEE